MRQSLLIVFSLLYAGVLHAQENTLIVTPEMINARDELALADVDGWIFREGNGADWADADIDLSNWNEFKPSELSVKNADENGKIEGWFRLKIRLDEAFAARPIFWYKTSFEAVDLYVDGELVHMYGKTKADVNGYKPYLNFKALPIPADLEPAKEHLIAIHFVESTYLFPARLKSELSGPWTFLSMTGQDHYSRLQVNERETLIFKAIVFSLCFVLSLFFWILVWHNPKERTLLLIAVFSSFFTIAILAGNLAGEQASFYNWWFYFAFFIFFIFAAMGILPLVISQIFTRNVSKKLKWIFFGQVMFGILNISIIWGKEPLLISAIVCFSICSYFIYAYWKSLRGAQWAIVGGIVLMLILLILTLLSLIFGIRLPAVSQLFGLPLPLSMLIYVSIRFKEMLTEVQINADKVIMIAEEKRVLLEAQKDTLEDQVKTRTRELSLSLENLKATQAQLIQSEKMASLGELTAGIAHEIQNPLNFVNNFSEVSKELLVEMKEELSTGSKEEAEAIADDLIQNLDKINHHGKRAASIVKGMLQHSRSSSGHKELTDINSLADEYLRLSYHGLRAKDKSFQADFKMDLDPHLPGINANSQDIGRVLLNLINNAFYAVSSKALSTKESGYKPEVIVTTSKHSNSVAVSIKDNGDGIPAEIKDKIFQPFFTTKPPGEGTGLGLSLSFEIIKAHGGEILLDTNEALGTTITLSLPINEM